MSAALLPCPFCGTTARIRERGGMWEGSSYYVLCHNEENCDAKGGMFCSPEAALNAWNRRVPATSDGADLEAAREDELDRLLALSFADPVDGGPKSGEAITDWLRFVGAMLPADRAALRRREDKTGSNREKSQ